MPQFLDLDAWPRRAAFDHFRRLEQPFFSLCASVDVTALPARAKAVPGATLFLAYHHAALRASNAVEPFRYRLQQGRVTVHERIDGSTTVLCADESIGFATLPFEPDFADFVEAALPQVADAKQAGFRLEAAAVEQAQIHMTTIPWLAFTSFTHARSLGGEDSVPKLAFGKIEQEGLRLKMPVAVEVHHALIDGLHVGRFFEALQDALDE